MTGSTGKIANLGAVRAMLADAKPVPIVRAKDSPDPHLPRNGVEAGKWEPGPLRLPKDCPVVPLGVAGNRAYFIDPIGQVQALDPPYGKGHLLGLFAGDANYISWAWPRHSKSGKIDGYAAEHAAAALVHACAAKGPWDSVDKVRGRGCWPGLDGDLILHTGTKLQIGGKVQPPGEIEGHVYPTRPPLALPFPGEIAAGANPAKLLRPLLESWQWARPAIDPVLLLGWIGAAYLSGALPWRPTAYLTGDAGTGKSTLQHLIKVLLGDWMLQSTDTTAAGLYQHIGTDSLAISVDEFEGEADTRAAVKVLKLARQSASGGLMLRGGEKNNPIEFRARSCFIFSSINTPPLRPQDVSRMAILRLMTLPEGSVPPEIDDRAMAIVGRCILRRLVDEWHRFDETWRAFRAELGRGGMDSRGQDTFATLLACADLIEHEGWSEDRLKVAHEGDLVGLSVLMAVANMHEFEDRGANWRKCLSHLLNVRVDAWRQGSRVAVGRLLLDLWYMKDDMNEGVARSMLAQAGLGLVKRRDGPKDWWLAVPNNNPLTRVLFEGSDWAGDIGAGVWSGALRQSPQGTIHQVQKARINGDVQACTLISLKGLYAEGGIMTVKEED